MCGAFHFALTCAEWRAGEYLEQTGVRGLGNSRPFLARHKSLDALVVAIVAISRANVAYVIDSVPQDRSAARLSIEQ